MDKHKTVLAHWKMGTKLDGLGIFFSVPRTKALMFTGHLFTLLPYFLYRHELLSGESFQKLAVPITQSMFVGATDAMLCPSAA